MTPGQVSVQLAPVLHRPSAYQRLVTAHGALRVNLTLGLLLAVIALGLIAPLLPLPNPIKPDPFNSLKPPSAEHWFGTDPNGFDVFSRTIHAIRTDFALSISSVLLGVLIGVPLGAISGYLGGVIDNLINRVSEVIQGFPQLLFGMAVLAVAGNTLVNVVLITAFYNVPVYAKMVRSVVLPLRDVEFVQAARLSGNSPLSVVFRHIIPNALLPVVSQFPLSCAYAVQMIAGLSFIGLGVQIPIPEWGAMIQQGANYVVFSKWWPSVFPGLALVLSVSLLSSLSDQLKVLVTRRA